MTGRANGVAHVYRPDGYFAGTSPERAREVLADEAATWERSGYQVAQVPADGQDHPFGQACQSCKPDTRLVGVSGIGRMAGTSRQGAWNLMDPRTHPDAPDPVPDQDVGGGRAWYRYDIVAYLTRMGRDKTWED